MHTEPMLYLSPFNRRPSSFHTLRMIGIVAVLACGIGFAGYVQAADQSVTVSANVIDVCKFETAQATTISFPALDPSAKVKVIAPTLTLSYRCTNDADVALSLGAGTVIADGTRRLRATAPKAGSPVGEIAYTLVMTALDGSVGRGFNTGTDPLRVTLEASIAAGDYGNAQRGVHEDTVVVTVNPL